MALRAFPIDYNRVRATLALVIQRATGLESNAVVMAEPEAPVAKRPETPFCEFQITTVAQQFGSDAIIPTDTAGVYRYVGPRLCTVQFQFYGETHEQAYGLACLLQCGLDLDPYLDLLRANQIVVWSRDTVTDISSLLSTGYEGRAAFSASFGLHSDITVDVGTIASVPVSATITGGSDSPPPIEFSVDLEEG